MDAQGHASKNETIPNNNIYNWCVLQDYLAGHGSSQRSNGMD